MVVARRGKANTTAATSMTIAASKGPTDRCLVVI